MIYIHYIPISYLLISPRSFPIVAAGIRDLAAGKAVKRRGTNSIQQANFHGIVSHIRPLGGSAMKIDGVRLRAKEMGIKIFRRTKKDIIRDIQSQEGHVPCYQDKAVLSCDQFHCCWRDDCRPAGEKAET